MTTSVSTRSPGRLNPTRQQLDELDALLQRMLDLPVNPLDEPEQAEAEYEAPVEEPPPPAPILEEPATDAEWSHTHLADEIEPAPVQPVPRPVQPPISYMVVETASPRPLPAASGFEPRPPMLTPRLVPVTPPPVAPEPTPVTNEEPEVENEEPPSLHPSFLTPPFVPPAVELPLPEADAGEMWVPLRSTWQPSPQTWPPLAESWHQANGGTPPLPSTKPIANPRIDSPPAKLGAASRAAPEARRAEPDLPMAPSRPKPEVRRAEPKLPPAPTNETPVPPAPAPVPAAVEPRLSLSAEDAPAAVPPLLLPLVWFNQGFDACLAPLGAPGRWVCGKGRSVLGFLGLACLAAAAAIAIGAGLGLAWMW